MLSRVRRLIARGSPGGGNAREVTDAEERMRSVVDHVLDAIITIDSRGVIDSFNPAAERIFCYSRSEVLGRNVSTLMPEPDRSQHDGYLASYLQSGEAKIIGIGREVIGRRKDGTTFPMELAISEFHLGTQRYFTGIVRDITDRKRLEHELHERLKQLAEADQRKDQFIGMLGHELRNPLAPVNNGLQFLRRSLTAEGAVGATLGMMERQVAQMVRLIDDLLDVSRITSGKIELRRETVDLVAAVQQALETVRGDLHAKEQRIVTLLPPAPVYIHADAARIAQIVTNLLSNASKYSDPGRDITVTVEQAGEHVVTRVKDEGVGIPAGQLDAIFEIFVQIDPSIERRQGGLGLGLALVKSLTELHGGEVVATSDGPGQGSTFAVSLPRLAERRGIRDGATAAPPVFESQRLLIIDDNKDSADSLAAVLTAMGHEIVATLYSGEQAVEEVLRHAPNVVLCDIGMPGLSGFDVARRLRAIFKGRRLTLIAVTGYGRPEDVANAAAAGFDTHLVKPVDLDQLEAAIRAGTVAAVDTPR